jgi:hypothetical protein
MERRLGKRVRTTPAWKVRGQIFFINLIWASLRWKVGKLSNLRYDGTNYTVPTIDLYKANSRAMRSPHIIIWKTLWSLLHRENDPECCGSGMFISDPNVFSSRISGPGSKSNKKEDLDGKKVFLPFFIAIS